MSWTLPTAVVIIALAVLIDFTGVAHAAEYDFALTELRSGEQMTVESSTQGKPVVVHVWSARCPHCRLHMPYAAALYSNLDPEVAGFVSICVDSSAAEAREFMEKHDLAFPVLMADSGELSDDYLSLGWPTTFVLNRDGTLAGLSDTQGPQYITEVLELVQQAALQQK